MMDEQKRLAIEQLERISGKLGAIGETVDYTEIAIKALQTEPCEDMINRKHLLSEIDDLMKSPWFNRYRDDCGALHFGYIERKEAVEIVRDLCVKTEPPVQPKAKTEWIPVSERLPEETDEYIVSTIDTEDSDYHHVEIAFFSRHRYQWERLPINTMVTAWMPLPGPYNAESEE